MKIKSEEKAENLLCMTLEDQEDNKFYELELFNFEDNNSIAIWEIEPTGEISFDQPAIYFNKGEISLLQREDHAQVLRKVLKNQRARKLLTARSI